MARETWFGEQVLSRWRWHIPQYKQTWAQTLPERIVRGGGAPGATDEGAFVLAGVVLAPPRDPWSIPRSCYWKQVWEIPVTKWAHRENDREANLCFM